MTDPTTDGLEATADEIEGMVRNLCAYALGEPDPVQRYESLSHQQVLFQGMVEAIRRERGRLVADLIVAGATLTEVAGQTSLGTVVKVRKLLSLSGQTQRAREAVEARKEKPEEAEVDGLPTHLAAPSSKRLLTPADRAALGLPTET